MPYHLGCTAWGIKEWVGSFYKDKTKPADFLTQYASVFNSVEGNTTFYQVPEADRIKEWGAKTPKGFKFCFKFPQSVTHDQKLIGTDDEVIRFLDLFWDIREKLGPFMIQLPASFSSVDLSRLEHLFDILPKNLNYSVEVRHRDFFDHGKHERNLDALLKSYNIDRVIFDTRKLHSMQSGDSTIREAQKKKPKVPVRFNNTHKRPVIRFVGSNDILNNEPYLKEWAIVVAEWIKEGLHPYVFVHAPDPVRQPELCRHFHKLLSDLIQVPPLPAWPSEIQNEQLGLFE